MSEQKKIWESKTFWANVLLVLAALLTDVSNVLGADGTLTVAAVVNIGLRVVTKSAVVLK